MENEEILLRFDYNNRMYYVVNNSNHIRCYYLDNNTKHYDLDKEEKELIISIVYDIFSFRSPLKVMDYSINNHTYEVYMDKETSLYSFKPFPNQEDLIKLNMLFNNMEDYLALTEENEKPKETFFKRIIKVGSKYVVIFVAAGLLVGETISVATNFIKNSGPLYYDSAIIAMSTSSTLSDQEIIETIKSSVMSNRYLTEEEKEKILSNLTLFVDNKDNMDLDYVKNNLKTIKINYSPGPCKETGVMGCYNFKTNEITFYEADGFDDVEDFVFSHEVFHSLQKINYTSINSFLIETTNTIFNNEYSNTHEDSVYDDYLGYTKALMEIIDPSILKIYHNFPSNKFIVDALCTIIEDEDEAYRLLSNLNTYKNIHQEICNNPEDEELKTNLKDLAQTIKESLNKYYHAKYGFDLDNDLLMLYYIDKDAFHKEIKKDLEVTDMIMSVDEEKTYFNSYNTNNTLLTIHLLTNMGKTDDDIVITEDNRYLNNTLNNSTIK